VSRLAVTGAGGFIGGAVCRAALAAGHDVLAIGPGAVPAHPRLRHEPGRIADPGPLAVLLAGVEILIHAAGRGTPASVSTLDGPAAQEELNLARAVLDAAASAGVGKIVLVSSGGTIYGDVPGDVPITEAQPVAPSSPYGLLNAGIERLGFGMRRAGLACVAARLSNPYGPGQLARRGQGLVAAAFARVCQGEPIEVWGDGSTVRDYIYIGDAARGLLAAASRPGGSILHVSSGRGIATAQVVADVAALAGVKPRLLHRSDRDPGVARSVLCSARLTEQTGWRPLRDWRTGLAKTAARWLN
jgi:UDP-glucose 4-epimerase